MTRRVDPKTGRIVDADGSPLTAGWGTKRSRRKPVTQPSPVLTAVVGCCGGAKTVTIPTAAIIESWLAVAKTGAGGGIDAVKVLRGDPRVAWWRGSTPTTAPAGFGINQFRKWGVEVVSHGWIPSNHFNRTVPASEAEISEVESVLDAFLTGSIPAAVEWDLL